MGATLRRTMRWHLGVMGLFAWALDACSADPAIEEGQRAVEGVAMAADLVGLSHAFAAPIVGVSDDLVAAQRAAAVAQAAFTPSGCTRIQLQNNIVRVIFVSECRGPFGMRVLGGTLDATITLASGQTVAFSGEVRTAHSTLRPQLNVTLSYLEGTFQAQFAGNFTGTGARGTAVTFEGRGIGTLDSTCVQINGSSTITAGGAPWGVLISNYNRCADGCPRTAGSLLINRNAGAPTRVEFIGGQNISVTTASGRNEEVTVPCGG